MTFWLPELEEASSNKARKGDADYGIKSYDAAAEKRKKDAKKRAKQGGTANDKHPHAKGGPGGGQFIKKGDTGSEVGTVQDKLGIEHTGTYDAGTAASVVAFQRRHGLVADGIVGRQTALALTGQYDRARKAGPGALGPETSKLVGADSSPSPRVGKRRTTAGRRKSSRERVRGGVVIAQLEERHSDPFDLAEAKIDALGNVHDLLGQFTFKLGKKGKGSEHGVIPEYDPQGLTFGKSAGGSNGARIAHHKNGSKWLVKAYGGREDRVATELLSNAVYREMGARVPKAGRIRLHSGKQALAYPLLDGKPVKRVFQKRDAKPSAEVGAHFMTDALLANWDVAGLEDDNILWDPSGQPFRVDQGGTLEYRAMGQRKGFGDVPYEVTTMLLPGGQGARSAAVSPDGMRKQASAIAATLTDARIDALVKAAGFKDAAMAGRVTAALKARAAWMGRFGRGEVGLPDPPPSKKKIKDPTLWYLGEAEASWLTPLAEAALPYAWKEALHPRDQHGQFVKKIGGLPGGKAIQLDAKTTIKRDKDGSFRVVRSGGITKGFKTPEDAARAALDRSAKGKEADSVGGTTSHKDYNAYLKSRGFDPSVPEAFGGKLVDETDLAKEVTRLSQAVFDAGAGDKYEQRQVPTLKARLEEAKAKLKKLGGPDAKTTPQVGDILPGPSAKTLPAGTWVITKHQVSTWNEASTTTTFKALGDGNFQGYESGKAMGKPGPIVSDLYSVKVIAPPARPAPTAAKGIASAKVGEFIHNPMTAGTYQIIGQTATEWKLQGKGDGSFNGPLTQVEKTSPIMKVGQAPQKVGIAAKPATSPTSSMIKSKWHITKAGTTFKNSTGDLYAVKAADPDASTITIQKVSGQGGLGTVSWVAAREAIQTGNWTEVTPSADKPSTVAAPAAKGPKVSGFQATPGPYPNDYFPPKMKDIALAPGDVVQEKKGGWKWTLLEPSPHFPGAWKAEAANGQVKTLSYAKPIRFVKKADKSKVHVAIDAGKASAPKPPAPPAVLSPLEIKGKLGTAPPGVTIGQLKDGDVISTPDGKIGVMKTSEPAYTGYATAYDITTGLKFEPPADKAPAKFSNDPAVKKSAAEALAKAQTKTAPTEVATGAGSAGAGTAAQKGPPPKFAGIPSDSAAETIWSGKQHVQLTQTEKGAAGHYTNGGYGGINGALRSSTGVKDISMAHRIKALDDAISKQPEIEQAVILSRKTDVGTWKDQAQVGSVIQDNGFLSTSTWGGTWNGSVHLKILVPPGAKGLYVNAHGGASSHPNEKEVILPRGSQFHVLKREQTGGATVLYVELIV